VLYYIALTCLPACLRACLPAAVPPGHFFSAVTNSTTECPTGDAANPNGFYQPNWVQYNGVATACIPCGAGILSADNEPLNMFKPSDEGTATRSPSDTLLVPRTSDSCCTWQQIAHNC
jgi:hypothetical protein